MHDDAMAKTGTVRSMSETSFEYKTDRNCSGSVMNEFSFGSSKFEV